MDASPWPQGLQDIKLANPMEELGTNNINTGTLTRPILEKKARPPEHLNCPRCSSTNTKFCYYNNYSLTQPRYLCKTCRRYWTEGGSLRNVPVGGGSRKNKRSTSSRLNPDLNPPNVTHFSSIPNPNKTHQAQDLNLVFPVSLSHNYVEESTPDQSSKHQHNFSSTSSPFWALEMLRTGIASRGLSSYIPTPMPDSNTLYSSGFPLQEVKPAVSFNVDGLGSRYGVEENGGRILFPFGEMKQLPNASEVDQSKGQGNTTSGGYWNGMLGGGSW